MTSTKFTVFKMLQTVFFLFYDRLSQVKRNALSAFALQDLGTTLGVAHVLKALPPHIQVHTLLYVV